MWLKKILSYIIPLTKKVNSDKNGTLEITLINGKKILDAKNANYSFGSLQKVLEFGINKIDLSKVNEMLLLGLGGGSIIQSLINKYKFKGKIDAVEFDEKVIYIAANEFNITNNSQLKIINNDAYEYVTQSKNKYDLVVVDLFIDNEVPGKFLKKDFWNAVFNMLNTGGVVIFNAGINLENNNPYHHFFNKFNNINFETFNKVEQTNTIYLIHLK